MFKCLQATFWLIVLACMLAFSPPSMAEVHFAPAGHFFSIDMPDTPQEKTSQGRGTVATGYLSPQGSKIYMVTEAYFLEATFPSNPDPTIAMQSIVGGMVERMSGELLSIEKKEFTSSRGTKLPEKHFTFRSPKVWGEGIITMSGRRAYLVAVVRRGQEAGLNESDQKFISSFHVLN